MADPLSIAASVVGLLTAAIQVSQTILDFYDSYQNQDSEITRTTEKLTQLLVSLQALDKVLKTRTFQAEDQALVDSIEKSITSCEELVQELKAEYEKFGDPPASGVRATIKGAGRRLAYPFRQSTLAKLREDIGDIRENISLALNTLQVEDGGRVQNDVAAVKALLDLVAANQVSSSVRTWLNAPDASIDHNEACAKRHPSSGLWLVNGPAFTTWLNQDNSFIWINGFAGCGKSIICSTAVQHAFRHRRSDSGIGIAFFYFRFNDTTKQDVSAMLRAFLLQLSSQLKDDCADLVYLQSRYRSGTPPVPALFDCLKLVIANFKEVYLIVDALDESPKFINRPAVLDTISDLRGLGLSGLHLAVTSRDELDIREILEPSGQEDISMKNIGVDTDISAYISGSLHSRRSLKKWSMYHTRIQEVLIVRAKGVFRWVECQFRALEQCPRSEDLLESVLASLPESLDATYERMLNKIGSDREKQYASKILTMLCISLRPMSVAEIIDAIAVDLADPPKFNPRLRLQDGTDILGLCPGLIEEREDPDHYEPRRDGKSYPIQTFQISHYSVQEYLESDRIRNSTAASFGVDRLSDHASMTRICLVYLLEPTLAAVATKEAKALEFPFARYAARYWYGHYRLQGEDDSETMETSLELLIDQDAVENWLELHRPHNDSAIEEYYPDTPPLYYAALLGLPTLAKGLIEWYVQRLVGQPGYPTDPAEIAHTVVTAQGGPLIYALSAAAFNGHADVAEILLDYGADVHAEGGHYGTALQAAAQSASADVVKLLLSRGADINGQGGYHGTALQAVSRHYKGFDTVRLLLSEGADVNAKGGYCGNALQSAARNSMAGEIVELLIANGADVNAVGGYFGTALQAAATQPYGTNMFMLLANGADVNAVGGYYGTALQAAAEVSWTLGVFTLLRAGADPNVQGGHYGNALQAAAASADADTVALLLKAGADVNARGGYYGTALHAAINSISQDKLKKLQLLLAAGADPNARVGPSVFERVAQDNAMALI